MFVTSKVFVKKYFGSFYATLHDFLFPYYLTYFRNRKLKNFSAPQFKTVHYLGYSYQLLIDPANGLIDEEYFTLGIYEPEILALHKKYLKKGDVYLDVGANIGDTSMFARAVVGSEGRVVCYEPLAILVNQIKKSVEINKYTNVTIVPKGLGEKKEMVRIYKNPKNIGGSSVVKQSEEYPFEEIEISDGSEIQNLSRLDFVKIDVEGYELPVLRGLESLIKKYKPIITIEFSPSLYTIKDAQEILERLSAYSIYDIENRMEYISNPQEWFANFKKTQTNFICLPKKSNI